VFRQDIKVYSSRRFKFDFERITDLIKKKEQFAFARYADGEYLLLNGISVGKQTQAYQKDKWFSSGNNPVFRQALIESTYHAEPNYFYAISCRCCDPEGHKYYINNLQQSKEYITYSNLFINANYKQFKNFIKSLDEDVVLLAHKNSLKAEYPFNVLEICPAEEDCVNWYEKNYMQINQEVEALARKYNDKLFLVAIGPLSEIIIDRMYKVNAKNRYVDVGSALDEWTHSCLTRAYQDENSYYARKRCEL
jgi:hypothetical protein